MKKYSSLNTLHILLIILILAICIVLKFSTLPTPLFFPDFISTLFEKPKRNTNHYELFRLLENLSLAFITAFIIYLLIDFIPTRKSANKAYLINEERLMNIYREMGEIIATIKMILDLKKVNSDIIIEDLIKLKDYVPEFEKTYYKSSYSIKYKKEISKRKGVKSIFIFHEDLADSANYITKTIEKIIKLPITTNLDMGLIEIISSIESCDFILKCKSFTSPPSLNIPYHIAFFDKSFLEFIQLQEKLSKYNSHKYSYTYEKLSENEISEMKAEKSRVFETFKKDEITFPKGTKAYFNGIEYKVKDGKLRE